MNKPVYIITGRPGIGKSTLFSKIVDVLKENGYLVGGIQSPEVRDKTGRRIGFKIRDLMSGEEGWLARRGFPSKVKVGAYGVVVDEAERIIGKAFRKALDKADVIGIDEVGPMELKISIFRKYLFEILDSEKPIILVVHYRLRDPLILDRIRNSVRVLLTIENRDHYLRTYPYRILEEIESYYGKHHIRDA